MPSKDNIQMNPMNGKDLLERNGDCLLAVYRPLLARCHAHRNVDFQGVIKKDLRNTAGLRAPPLIIFSCAFELFLDEVVF